MHFRVDLAAPDQFSMSNQTEMNVQWYCEKNSLLKVCNSARVCEISSL